MNWSAHVAMNCLVRLLVVASGQTAQAGKWRRHATAETPARGCAPTSGGERPRRQVVVVVVGRPPARGRLVGGRKAGGGGQWRAAVSGA